MKEKRRKHISKETFRAKNNSNKKKVGLLSAGDITVAVRGSKGDVTLRTEAMIGCTCGPLRVLLRVMMNLTHQDLLILVQFRRRPTDNCPSTLHYALLLVKSLSYSEKKFDLSKPLFLYFFVCQLTPSSSRFPP